MYNHVHSVGALSDSPKFHLEKWARRKIHRRLAAAQTQSDRRKYQTESDGTQAGFPQRTTESRKDLLGDHENLASAFTNKRYKCARKILSRKQKIWVIIAKLLQLCLDVYVKAAQQQLQSEKV